MFIVWTETRDNVVKATRKATKRAAVMAYNKLARDSANFKTVGWSVSEDAHPQVRRAVGLKPFLELGERDTLSQRARGSFLSDLYAKLAETPAGAAKVAQKRSWRHTPTTRPGCFTF